MLDLISAPYGVGLDICTLQRRVVFCLETRSFSRKTVQSIESSYRDLPLPAIIIAMAHDLFDVVSAPMPESTIYVLGESILNAISDIPAKNCKAVNLSNWLGSLKQTDVLNAIGPLKMHSSNLENRIQPLIAIVRAVLGGQIASEEMLGDLLNVDVTPRQLGMWLFRDLLAEKLVEEHDRE